MSELVDVDALKGTQSPERITVQLEILEQRIERMENFLNDLSSSLYSVSSDTTTEKQREEEPIPSDADSPMAHTLENINLAVDRMTGKIQSIITTLRI